MVTENYEETIFEVDVDKVRLFLTRLVSEVRFRICPLPIILQALSQVECDNVYRCNFTVRSSRIKMDAIPDYGRYNIEVQSPLDLDLTSVLASCLAKYPNDGTPRPCPAYMLRSGNLK